MKIKNKSKNLNKKIFILVVFIFVFLAITVILNKEKKSITVDQSNSPVVSINQKTEDTNKAIKDDNSSSANVSSSLDLPMTVTAIGQDQKSGPLLIRTIVDNLDGGLCSYRLTKGSIIKNYSSDVIFSGTYYSCNYTVPYADVTNGTWNVEVSASQNNKNGKVSRSIVVE
jgi:hypothetical protein